MYGGTLEPHQKSQRSAVQKVDRRIIFNALIKRLIGRSTEGAVNLKIILTLGGNKNRCRTGQTLKMSGQMCQSTLEGFSWKNLAVKVEIVLEITQPRSYSIIFESLSQPFLKRFKAPRNTSSLYLQEHPEVHNAITGHYRSLWLHQHTKDMWLVLRHL